MGRNKQKGADKSAKIDFFKRQQYLRELEPTPEEFRTILEGMFKPAVVEEIILVRTEYAFMQYCAKHDIVVGTELAVEAYWKIANGREPAY